MSLQWTLIINYWTDNSKNYLYWLLIAGLKCWRGGAQLFIPSQTRDKNMGLLRSCVPLFLLLFFRVVYLNELLIDRMLAVAHVRIYSAVLLLLITAVDPTVLVHSLPPSPRCPSSNWTFYLSKFFVKVKKLVLLCLFGQNVGFIVEHLYAKYVLILQNPVMANR